jgi:CubicO group peptidase (beta-lactamase class C family)
VLQHGRVIHEAYFAGHQRAMPVTSFSVAKSMLSALFDAALADGLITSLDDAVTSYLPELRARDERFAQVTLRHLLDMHSGIAYREFPFFNGDNAKTYYWPDLRALALQHTRIAGEPRREWQYNNYHPLLLGLVLERVTKLPVATYLGQRLWQPAGLGPGASWSVDSPASAFEKLESGVNARALDFARFGQLFLDGGVAADGTRVLPETSVRDAVSPSGAVSLSTLRPGLAYRQFWWIQQRAGGEADFSARGNHGQFVFVSPRNGVVIARFGRRHGHASGVWMQFFERLADELGKP